MLPFYIIQYLNYIHLCLFYFLLVGLAKVCCPCLYFQRTFSLFLYFIIFNFTNFLPWFFLCLLILSLTFFSSCPAFFLPTPSFYSVFYKTLIAMELKVSCLCCRNNHFNLSDWIYFFLSVPFTFSWNCLSFHLFHSSSLLIFPSIYIYLLDIFFVTLMLITKINQKR